MYSILGVKTGIRELVKRETEGGDVWPSLCRYASGEEIGCVVKERMFEVFILGNSAASFFSTWKENDSLVLM